MLPILSEQPRQQPECQRNLLLLFAIHGDDQNRTGRKRDNSQHDHRYREWHSIRQYRAEENTGNITGEQNPSTIPAGTTETAIIAEETGCIRPEKSWSG